MSTPRKGVPVVSQSEELKNNIAVEEKAHGAVLVSVSRLSGI